MDAADQLKRVGLFFVMLITGLSALLGVVSIVQIFLIQVYAYIHPAIFLGHVVGASLGTLLMAWLTKKIYFKLKKNKGV